MQFDLFGVLSEWEAMLLIGEAGFTGMKDLYIQWAVLSFGYNLMICEITMISKVKYRGVILGKVWGSLAYALEGRFLGSK